MVQVALEAFDQFQDLVVEVFFYAQTQRKVVDDGYQDAPIVLVVASDLSESRGVFRLAGVNIVPSRGEVKSKRPTVVTSSRSPVLSYCAALEADKLCIPG
jgi:hypothetical protein